MLSKRMTDALNGQANREFYSAYLYLSMSAYFESLRMSGMANWMRVQAGEELVHAMRMYDYVVAAGGRAKMLAVEEPQFSWASPADAFQHVWNHERAVTGLIKALVGVSISESDDATNKFLQWYVDEQVEEEESSETVLVKVKAAGGDDGRLRAVDDELGRRRFKFPRGYSIFAFGLSTVGSLKR